MMLQPTDLEVAARLAMAVACGGVIGIERDLRNMPTGFRTLALVCLGSCVAIIAAIKAGDTDGFSRIAQGLVTGIGFLGGGVILQGKAMAEVKGLTTAAAIWFVAAVGLLCGLGELKLAGMATLAAILVLAGDLFKKRAPEAEKPTAPTDAAKPAAAVDTPTEPR